MLTFRNAILSCWLLAVICAPSAALAESPSEMISSYRASHGLGRVTRDGALDRIAQTQASAMAARDVLARSGRLVQFAHGVLKQRTRCRKHCVWTCGLPQDPRSMDQVQRASEKSAHARRLARRRRERDKCEDRTHLLGDGDRRGLRTAEAGCDQGRTNDDNDRGKAGKNRGEAERQGAGAALPNEIPRPVLLALHQALHGPASVRIPTHISLEKEIKCDEDCDAQRNQYQARGHLRLPYFLLLRPPAR
jgi:hypothetical protein